MGRLATIDSEGRPNAVPICFALDAAVIYSAVDAKPKRSRGLKRLANIEAHPDVSILVDRYEDDWTRLWWIVAEGVAEVVSEGRRMADAIDLLVEKYPQYRVARPAGPVIAVSVRRWKSWSATPGRYSY